MRFLSSLGRAALPVLLALLVALSSAAAQAARHRYVWNGPTFTTASGTVSTADSVSGFLVLQGPVEDLPFVEVSPVAFSFSAGPVTIDDTTPLHPFTTIKLQTDASGSVLATEIQWVEAIDPGPPGTPFPGDVICVGSCQVAGSADLVIDRDISGAVLGEGEVPIGGSFWAEPTLLAQDVPALPWPLLTLGIPIAICARRHLRP